MGGSTLRITLLLVAAGPVTLARGSSGIPSGGGGGAMFDGLADSLKNGGAAALINALDQMKMMHHSPSEYSVVRDKSGRQMYDFRHPATEATTSTMAVTTLPLMEAANAALASAEALTHPHKEAAAAPKVAAAPIALPAAALPAAPPAVAVASVAPAAPPATPHGEDDLELEDDDEEDENDKMQLNMQGVIRRVQKLEGENKKLRKQVKSQNEQVKTQNARIEKMEGVQLSEEKELQEVKAEDEKLLKAIRRKHHKKALRAN